MIHGVQSCSIRVQDSALNNTSWRSLALICFFLGTQHVHLSHLSQSQFSQPGCPRRTLKGISATSLEKPKTATQAICTRSYSILYNRRITKFQDTDIETQILKHALHSSPALGTPSLRLRRLRRLRLGWRSRRWRRRRGRHSIEETPRNPDFSVSISWDFCVEKCVFFEVFWSCLFYQVVQGSIVAPALGLLL